jgi:hypothetical protein
VRNKSTEDFRWLPYVTTLLSTSLWTFYGLLKPHGLLVVTVNGAGAALEAVYVTLYRIYAPRETKVHQFIYIHVWLSARSYSSSISLTARLFPLSHRQEQFPAGIVSLFVYDIIKLPQTNGLATSPNRVERQRDPDLNNICLLLWFSQAKMGKLVLAVNVGFLAAVVAVALLALHGGARLFAVGLLCAALTIGMYAAPLGSMVSILY